MKLFPEFLCFVCSNLVVLKCNRVCNSFPCVPSLLRPFWYRDQHVVGARPGSKPGASCTPRKNNTPSETCLKSAFCTLVVNMGQLILSMEIQSFDLSRQILESNFWSHIKWDIPFLNHDFIVNNFAKRNNFVIVLYLEVVYVYIWHHEAWW